MGTAPAPAAAGDTSKSTKSSAKTVTKASGAGTTTKKKPARKKKPTSKSASASTNQATWTAARTAQMDLAAQRSSAAEKISDPLWYRVEDLVSSDSTKMAENGKVLPEQIKVVEAALKHNNLTRVDVTPQAFACLLEQARRYALEIMADSQLYASHAKRHEEITRADLQLASEMRPDHPISISTQLPKLNLLAQQINRAPLPPIPTQCYSGVLLPPKQHQLTARTFDVVSGAQVAHKMVQSTPAPPARKGSKSSKTSYGASRGRQIAIQLKEKPKETTTSSTGGTAATGDGAATATGIGSSKATAMDVSSPEKSSGAAAPSSGAPAAKP